MAYNRFQLLSSSTYTKRLASHVTCLNCCRGWIWTEGNLQVLSFAVVHALVALRVRVLWNNSPRVKTLLNVMDAVYLVATLIITNYVNAILLPTVDWLPSLNLCFGVVLRFTAWAFVPSLMFECLLFSLTSFRAIQHRGRDIAVTEGVIGVLYRDGILYFLAIASCCLFNIIVWAALRSSLSLLAKFFTFSFINVMASRIVLNLRAQRRDAAFDDQSTQRTSGSGSSGGLPGFSFADRLRAARFPANTRQLRQQHHTFGPPAPGEQIVLHNFGNRGIRPGRYDLEDARISPPGKVVVRDLRNGGRSPPVCMGVEVKAVMDMDADGDHIDYDTKYITHPL
ncbi:hypothetical protein FRB93_007603 [Tulasnella sp. JGI-2019a]|nr:hypothetical protein FRB93_007603 [Tulasnella sp. JGI-2019a]